MLTRKGVFQALNNARANDHDMKGWPAIVIVVDLLDYDADAADMSEDELLPHVEAWLAERAKEDK